MILYDVLNNPEEGKLASKGDEFRALMMERFRFLCHAHVFVRLLDVSPQTDRIRAAAGRLRDVFDDALADLDREVDSAKFRAIDCDALAKAQLGSGLIVLNTLLEPGK